MADINVDMVKKLRDQTGVGMMDCKKALTQTGGDFEKAITMLREKGIAIAAKREAKSASEGLIGSFITPDAKTGVLVEVNCETTFVAKTDEFVEFAKGLAKHIASSQAPADVAALLDQPFTGGQTVRERLSELMGKIGEKMAVTRFARLDTDGLIGSYIHMGDQIGVLVELKGASAADNTVQLAKDLAMHVSWSNPDYLKCEEITAEALEKERQVHKQWAIKEGKPEQVIDRIVEGRMKDFYSKVCLLEQPYVKDEDQTILTLISNAAKQCGQNISVGKYVRFRVGETAGE